MISGILLVLGHSRMEGPCVYVVFGAATIVDGSSRFGAVASGPMGRCGPRFVGRIWGSCPVQVEAYASGFRGARGCDYGFEDLA